MALTPKQLAQYAKVCQKYGITELSLDGTAFKIEPVTIPALDKVQQPIGEITNSELPQGMTEEDLLFWSSSPPQG